LANFGPAKTITPGQIMPQRVCDLNPLLIFMCAIRVKSGTGVRGQGGSFGGMMDREISCILAGEGWGVVHDPKLDEPERSGRGRF
jgi:hypothetical protein